MNSRFWKTLASKESSSGSHIPSPPEGTPPSTLPAPKFTKRGPPESPWQVFESVPGAPIGVSKGQQTCAGTGTTPRQLDTVTEPSRRMP
jgi:hypothetical protein